MNNIEVKNGIAFFNPPLKVESVVYFAAEHLDCDFIYKPLTDNFDDISEIIAYAYSPEYSSRVNDLFIREYIGKGYSKMNGLSSSMVNSID